MKAWPFLNWGACSGCPQNLRLWLCNTTASAPPRRASAVLSLKAEKQRGVDNKDLLVNIYQHLLEECLTAGAADMNNYCPVNSSTQIAVQFVAQALTFLFTQSANLQSLGQVRKSLETYYSSHRSSRHEADVHWPADFISHVSISVLQKHSPSCFSAFKEERRYQR